MALNNIENRMLNLEYKTIEFVRKNRKINNIVNRMFNFEYERTKFRRKIKKIMYEIDVNIEILEKEKMEARNYLKHMEDQLREGSFIMLYKN